MDVKSMDGVTALSGGTEEMILLAHDMSMSADPMTACQGRALKEMAHFHENWMLKEMARGTEGAYIVATTIAMASSLMATSICNTAPPPLRRLIGDSVRSGFIEQFNKALESIGG